MDAKRPAFPQMRRGQIWAVHLPTDPPDKLPRPVLIVSSDGRNTHPHSTTVLVVPFHTTLTEVPIHIRFTPGETGLQNPSELRPENISMIDKASLVSMSGTRTLSDRILRDVARNVVFSMGIQPKDIL